MTSIVACPNPATPTREAPAPVRCTGFCERGDGHPNRYTELRLTVEQAQRLLTRVGRTVALAEQVAGQ